MSRVVDLTTGAGAPSSWGIVPSDGDAASAGDAGEVLRGPWRKTRRRRLLGDMVVMMVVVLWCCEVKLVVAGESVGRR